MTPVTSVVRCSFCGAPLPQPSAGVFRVHCPYCTIENRLLTAEAEAAHQLSETLKSAAEEGAGIVQQAELQRQKLQAMLEGALQAGEKEAAVRYFEGMLRMSYAATVHLYRSGLPPEHAEPALKQIDEVIGQAVRTFAEQVGLAI